MIFDITDSEFIALMLTAILLMASIFGLIWFRAWLGRHAQARHFALAGLAIGAVAIVMLQQYLCHMNDQEGVHLILSEVLFGAESLFALGALAACLTRKWGWKGARRDLA